MISLLTTLNYFQGANFQANFWFGGKLECGSPAPDILLQVERHDVSRHIERDTGCSKQDARFSKLKNIPDEKESKIMDRSYNIRKKGNKGEEKEQQFPRQYRKNSYCQYK